jgi:pimeloyl-ACP methyl ester carboxylesterase
MRVAMGRVTNPHDPAAYELPLHVGDIVAVLDALNLRRAPFWGYSMGGWIGFGMAKYAPERVQALIIGGQHPRIGNSNGLLALPPPPAGAACSQAERGGAWSGQAPLLLGGRERSFGRGQEWTASLLYPFTEMQARIDALERSINRYFSRREELGRRFQLGEGWHSNRYTVRF